MSIPSLRQQMINEALDYHMNMNHIVFNRERKHVEIMGQQTLDKKQSDIIIEGNIRDRISRIMTSIQKLIQGVQFETEEPKPIQLGTEEEVQSTTRVFTIPGSQLRISKYITDSISNILNEYNSLCEYFDLQNRQRTFSQSDISGIDSLVKQLIDPLKSALGFSSGIFSQQKTDNQRAEYTRIYNVITTMIKNIEIGFPFQKVSVSFLTERVPLKDEYIQGSRYDPTNDKNLLYLMALLKQLDREQRKVNMIPDHTQYERDAKQLSQQAIDNQLRKLEMGGHSIEELREYIKSKASIQKESLVAQSKIKKTAQYASNKIEEERRKRGPEEENLRDENLSVEDTLRRNRLLNQIISDAGDKEFTYEDTTYVIGSPEGKDILTNEVGFVSMKKIFKDLFGQREEEEEERKGPVDEAEFKGDEGLTAKEKSLLLLEQIIRDAEDKEFTYGGTTYTVGSPEGKSILTNRVGFVSMKKIFKDLFGQPKRKALIGEGLNGGHVHKTENFDDQAELEPYLTKHLRPSKYRKNVPPIESSSEESSGEEDGSDMEINNLRIGKGRKQRGQMQDMKAISKLPVVEATVLMEKKRGGAKKLMRPINKPVFKDSRGDKDLWFL